MNARDVEKSLIEHCVRAARPHDAAHDIRDANVFRLAAMTLQSRFPAESDQLMRASESYFLQHPGDRMAAADVVRKGWIANLPRLRDMLSRELSGG